jgi:hypothetical protein
MVLKSVNGTLEGQDMFINLPQPVQQQVLYYLGADNFRAAKELYDLHLSGSIHSENTESDDELS